MLFDQQDPQYRPQNEDQARGNVVQQCGEVLHAIGKIERWGNESTNPRVPRSQKETNRRLALRKITDLKSALAIYEEYLAAPDVGFAIFTLDDFLSYVRKLRNKGGLASVRSVLRETNFNNMPDLVQAGEAAMRRYCENASKYLGEEQGKTPSPKLKVAPPSPFDVEDDFS